LMAIDLALKTSKEKIEITSWGMFIGDYYNWEEEPIIWNLLQNLHGQTIETLEFLHSLLFKS
jgi:hypothetical protein